MTPVSGAIVGGCVKVVVVGGGEIIAIELDWDPGVESGRLEVSGIRLEVVECVLGPGLWSLCIKSMVEMQYFYPSRWAPNMSVSKVETLKVCT